ncbi:Pleckstrin homology domain containing protein, partial [Oryctes borbonicus]
IRWCFVRIDFFICYLDADLKNVEECLSMESVVSAQLLDDPKFDVKIDDAKLYCFELRTAIDRYIFGTKDKNQRSVWMRKIGESLNCKLIHEVADYQRIGWLYAREGINGTWFGAWLLLSNRTLFYTTNNDVTHSIDLRKVRCILLQETTDTDCLPQVLEQGPYLVIDFQKGTFYYQSWNLAETECWYSSIRKANRNGSRLEDQQLYNYDVPVIVEKCINFIYLHGTLLAGIYRRAGQKTKCEQVANHFRQDAWSTQLPPDIYSGYEVATAFKIF